MKRIAWALLGALCVAQAARAEDAVDVYTGLALNGARSTLNGASNNSAGIGGLLSARYVGKYYGFEVQGGYFGKSGPYTSNGEVDLCALGLLPLGGGIVLYGKAGAADVVSKPYVNNTNITFGAGVEVEFGKAAIRLGAQHFYVGAGSRTSSVGTNLVGVTILMR